MKKQKLLEKLGQSPDGISLHDASFLHFNWFDDTVEFTIEINEYHYLINGLEDDVEDVKAPTLLKMIFRGIRQFTFKSNPDFSFGDCEILQNKMENNEFVLSVVDYGFDAIFRFSYESFDWIIL